MVKLYLAPMEGLGDRPFRMAMASVGGFDEACTDFIRVPINAHCLSLAKVYNHEETVPIPIAAQVMGFDLDLMPRMCQELERRGAPRIDLNCGCPSNRVTGRGAGSSLLLDPGHMQRLIEAMVASVKIPVSVKIRSGYSDTSNFKEILFAVEEAGAIQIAIHPRTKEEGYRPPANWDLIRQAKEILSIPVIGNGDVLSAADATRMVKETGCDGVMIGRGAARNPWIFHEIREAWGIAPSPRSWEGTDRYLRYFHSLLDHMRPRQRLNKLKQLTNYLLQDQSEVKKELLRMRELESVEYLEILLSRLFSIEKNALISYK